MNSITTAIDNLLAVVSDFKTSLLKKANAERQEMLDVSARLATSRYTIHSLMRVCDDTGTSLINTATSLESIVKTIDNLLDGDISIPEIPFEKYRGRCENCGRDISVDEITIDDEDGVGIICSDCITTTEENQIAEEA